MGTRRVDAIDSLFVPSRAAHWPSAATGLAVTASLCLIGARLLALLVARLSLATLAPALLALLSTLALLLALLRTLTRLLRLLAFLPSALLAAWLSLLAPLTALPVPLPGWLLCLIVGRDALVLSGAEAALHDLLLA